MMRTLILVSFLLQLAQAAPPQPARDVRIPTGAASISGVVVSDDGAARPVRRALIHAQSEQLPRGISVVTDARGVFALRDLPAGRYTLRVSRDGYATTTYGATRPGRPGAPIVVADGQQVADLKIALQRTGAITGVVTDQSGQPLPQASVRAMRYSFVNGQRQLTGVGSAGGSDDRGVYRIYNLPAGDYIVHATHSASMVRFTLTEAPSLTLTSAADVARAKQELSAPPVAQAAPGVQSSATAPSRERARSIAYPSIFYPGTAVSSQAATISIGAGEERSGVDITMHLATAGRIEGSVTVPDGVVMETVAVALVAVDEEASLNPFETVRTARPGKDGRFSYSSVRPGRYVVTARAGSAAGAQAVSAAGFSVGNLWAMTEVVSDGNDIANVALDLQPGTTVSGRIQFEAAELQPPSDLTRFRVTLSAIQSGRDVTMPPSPGTVSADGTFTISGVTPGRYRITSFMPTGTPNASRWALKSAIAGGVDTLDRPIEIRPHQHVADVVVTFTDRAAEISGLVQDASGKPSGGQVILFPEDRSHWWPQSRRIHAVRPAQDGKYTVRHVAPGDYLMVALIDVEQGEWFDPTFLQRLAPSAIRISVAEGEKKTQDLRVAQ